MPRPFLIPPILLLVSLAAASCGPAATPIAEALPPAEVLSPTVVSAPPEATRLPTAFPAPTTPPESAPTEPVYVGPGGQFATDPSTVNLASGQPTLVKFFAFW